MSGGKRKGKSGQPRMPATKYGHLRKKLRQSKAKTDRRRKAK